MNTDHSKTQKVEKITIRQLNHHPPPRSLRLLHATSSKRKRRPFHHQTDPQPQPSASTDYSPLLQPSPARFALAGKPFSEGQRGSRSLFKCCLDVRVALLWAGKWFCSLAFSILRRWVFWTLYYVSHRNTPFPQVLNLSDTGTAGMVWKCHKLPRLSRLWTARVKQSPKYFLSNTSTFWCAALGEVCLARKNYVTVVVLDCKSHWFLCFPRPMVAWGSSLF